MKAKEFLRTNLLSLLLILGVLSGIVVGVTLQTAGADISQRQVAYIKFPGELFLQMMKMILIPVVVSSLLTATADIDVRASGRISLLAIAYYLLTFVLASGLAVLLSVTIKPGFSASGDGGSEPETYTAGSPLYAFMDLLRNMIPDNLVEACFKTRGTFDKIKEAAVAPAGLRNSSGLTQDEGANGTITPGEAQLVVTDVPGVNMIGLVTVSMVTGSAISYIGKPVKPVYDLLLAVRLIVFQLVGVFMWYAPVGIGFLIAGSFASLPNLGQSLHNLVIFTVVVLAGLALHGFLVLPLLYLVVVRKNPYIFLRNLIPAMLLAFGSESSGVTLPVTIRCLEEKNRVDPRVTKLLSSVGATINMDGICLYFTMMTIFIAQLEGITMNGGQLVTASLLAMSTAIGVGCVSGAHLVYMTMVPAALNLPIHNISLLFAVDWLLTRCRTVVNILGDCFGAGIIEALSSRELRRVRQTPSMVLEVNDAVDKHEESILTKGESPEHCYPV